MIFGSETHEIEASYCLLLIVSFSQSFILIFSTLLMRAGISSLEQVFFRIIFALPPIFLLARYKAKLIWRGLVHYVPSGCVFSAFLMSGLSSIALGTAIAVTVGLIYTQPLFTAVIAAISGREKIGRRHFMVIMIGVIGALLVSGVLNERMSNNGLLGIILALSGALWYSFYLFLKRGQRTVLNPMQGMFGTLLFAVPCTLILGLILRSITADPALVDFSSLNIQQLALLMGLGLISTALPYGTLNHIKTRLVSPTTEGTILLLDPLFHTVWAMLFFQQFLSYPQFLGFGLIITSAALMMRIGVQRRSTD